MSLVHYCLEVYRPVRGHITAHINIMYIHGVHGNEEEAQPNGVPEHSSAAAHVCLCVRIFKMAEMA